MHVKPTATPIHRRVDLLALAYLLRNLRGLPMVAVMYFLRTHVAYPDTRRLKGDAFAKLIRYVYGDEPLVGPCHPTKKQTRATRRIGPIAYWDTSELSTMRKFFHALVYFNEPLTYWNTSKVQNICSMFQSASSFNQPLEQWDVSNVRDMCSTFEDADAFNQPLERWNVANVRDMRRMFFCSLYFLFGHHHHYSFNQPLDKWTVHILVNMNKMFYGCVTNTWVDAVNGEIKKSLEYKQVRPIRYVWAVNQKL